MSYLQSIFNLPYFDEQQPYVERGWNDDDVINAYNNSKINNSVYPHFSNFESTGRKVWFKDSGSNASICAFRMTSNDIKLYNDYFYCGNWVDVEASNILIRDDEYCFFLFNLIKVSDLTSSDFNGKGNYFYEAKDFSYDSVFVRGEHLTLDKLKEKYGDKYIIVGARQFKANDNLPRTVMPTGSGNEWLPYEEFISSAYYKDWDKIDNTILTKFVPILRYPITNWYWYFGESIYEKLGINTNNSFINISAADSMWSYYNISQNSNITLIDCSSVSQSENTGGNLDSGYHIMMKLFDLDWFVNAMNKYRIPFTFSLDEAINKKISDFTSGYVADGQPVDSISGGKGNGDNFSDNVTNANPTLTSINSYNRMYAMTEQQLNNLQNYIWNSTFLDNLKLLYNDKSQAIISLNLFPINFSRHDTLGNDRNIVIGNVETEVQGTLIPSHYNCNFNGGTYHIKEYFGSAFDYAPYTQISLYVPYFGIKKLDTNDVMNKRIRLNYLIDLSSGMCQAQVWVTDDKIEKLLYTYDTSIAINIPISTNDKNEQLKNKIGGTVSSIGGLIASASTGNVLGMTASGINLAKNVSNNRMNVDKGSAIDSFSSWYAVQTPYIIIERPIQSIASNYASLNGYPCNISATLSELKGYTECSNVQLKNMSCTDTEKIIIKDLLESGIIIG